MIAKDSAASEEPRKERRYPGIILRWEVEIPEANMSSPQVADFLTKLAATISALSPIILLAVGQGSLLLTVDMSEHDVISMLKRFAFGRPGRLGYQPNQLPVSNDKVYAPHTKAYGSRIAPYSGRLCGNISRFALEHSSRDQNIRCRYSPKRKRRHRC